MPENPPGLTLNSVPFPGLLASIELREAYRQYKLELAKRPPPEPPAPIEPGPSLYDIISDGLNDSYRAGLEEGRKESRTTPQARQDAERLQRLMNNRDLGLDDAGKSLCQDLMREGVHDRTAANRVSQAKKALGGDLATG